MLAKCVNYTYCVKSNRLKVCIICIQCIKCILGNYRVRSVTRSFNCLNPSYLPSFPSLNTFQPFFLNLSPHTTGDSIIHQLINQGFSASTSLCYTSLDADNLVGKLNNLHLFCDNLVNLLIRCGGFRPHLLMRQRHIKVNAES